MNASTNTSNSKLNANVDAFSRALVLRLSQSTDSLGHDVTERLRAARVQAVAKRKLEVAQSASVVQVQNGAVSLNMGGGEGGLWSKFASVLPLVALVAGMVTIGWIQDDMRADELASVDAELLTDDLPPAAYVDSGFLEFLKSNRAAQ